MHISAYVFEDYCGAQKGDFADVQFEIKMDF